jgi:hypothetical protein
MEACEIMNGVLKRIICSIISKYSSMRRNNWRRFSAFVFSLTYFCPLNLTVLIRKVQLILRAQNTMTWTFSILCNNTNYLTLVPHTVTIVSNTCNFSLEFLSTKERKTCTYRRISWNCASHAYVPVCNSKTCTARCSIMNRFAVSTIFSCVRAVRWLILVNGKE